MRRLVLASAAFLLVLGCGPTSSNGGVKGNITYQGKPVNAAGILLYPSSGDKDAVSIMIPVTQEGAFNSTDVPKGDYKVVVKAASLPKGGMQPGVNSSPGGPTPTVPFPDKYKDVKTTDLTVSIKPGDQTPLNLDLKD